MNKFEWTKVNAQIFCCHVVTTPAKPSYRFSSRP